MKKKKRKTKKKGQEHIHNSSLMWIKKLLQCLVRWTTCAFPVFDFDNKAKKHTLPLGSISQI